MNVHIDFRRMQINRPSDIANYRTASEVQRPPSSNLAEVEGAGFLTNRILTGDKHEFTLSRDDETSSNRRSIPFGYVEEEIRRIQLEAQRKERNLKDRFYQLRILAKDALGTGQRHSNPEVLEERMQRFEQIIGVLLSKQAVGLRGHHFDSHDEPLSSDRQNQLNVPHHYDPFQVVTTRAEDTLSAFHSSLESHQPRLEEQIRPMAIGSYTSQQYYNSV